MIESTVSYVGLTVAPIAPANSEQPAVGTISKARRTVSAGRIRAALAQGQPGNWASDHYTESQKFTGWNYIAVRAIALQASQAECQVFDSRGSSGGGPASAKQRFKAYQADAEKPDPLPADHPLPKLLKRPNPTQSGASFNYERVVQLGLTGTCMIVNIPNRMGLVVERYVVPTCMTTPIAPTPEYPMGAWRISPNIRGTSDPEGYVELRGLDRLAGAVVPAAVPGETMQEPWMQVIRWPHPIFKDDGQSGVSAGALWIDTSDMTDQARWAQLKNGPKPSCAVIADPEMRPSPEEIDAATVAFNAKYAGPQNTGKAIFVTAGSVVPLNYDAVEMAYEAAHRQLGQSILGLHAVPPVAAGLQEGGSYAAFYASLKQFSHLTVQPTLNLLAEEDTEAIAWQFGDGLVIELEAQAIDDPSVLEQRLATDINGRAITKDELRALRGLPPAKSGGDEWAGNDAEIPLAIGGGAARDMGAMPRADQAAAPAGKQPATPASVPASVGGEPLEEAAGTLVSDEAGVKTELTLNGAQVTSAVELLDRLRLGTLAESAATELLVAVGIPRERAQTMVRAQQAMPSQTPADKPPEVPGQTGPSTAPPGTEQPRPQPEPKHLHAGNGHRPVNRIAALFSPVMQAAVEGVLSSTETSDRAKAAINDALGSILKESTNGNGKH